MVPRGLINEARNRYTNERQKRLEYEKQLESWGGSNSVQEALDLIGHMGTEDGVIDLFIETGRSLGLGVRELEALFAQTLAESNGTGGGGEDEEQLLTMREARELLNQELGQRDQRYEQGQQAVRTQEARRVVSDVLGQLGVDEADATVILQLGDRYLPDGSLDPDQVAAAVRRGHADWLEVVEKRSQEYLRQKAAHADGVPKTPAGGAAPAPSAPEPPQSVDEAKARVRERLRAMT